MTQSLEPCLIVVELTVLSWESSFYFIGFVGCLCGGSLIYFGYDSPEDHPSITEEELDLLRENVIQGPPVLKCKSFFEIHFRLKI